MKIRRTLEGVRHLELAMEINLILDAAEACFETDPCSRSEAWFEEKFVQHFVQHQTKKMPCTTHVQQQKHTKTYKNDAKQK